MSREIDIVLGNYSSAVSNLNWYPIGTSGGFSGARLWRGDRNGVPELCLKAWPVDYPFARLQAIHRWLALARNTADLDFVPAIFQTNDSTTAVSHSNRIWDLTTWMPGFADFKYTPSPEKLVSVCQKIAILHHSLSHLEHFSNEVPAFRRRCNILTSFQDQQPKLKTCLLNIRSMLSDYDRDSIQLIERLDTGFQRLPALVQRALFTLRSWIDKPCRIKPCNCDLWHDHVLFMGSQVSGIIDFGAMKYDHPAIDLARFLGDVSPYYPDSIKDGVATYNLANPPEEVSEDLVRAMDESGVICAVIGWIQRLSSNCNVDQIRSAHSRISHVMTRLENFGE